MARPGCGFALAAFCDTFDAPAAAKGRAGELDVTRWSAGRMRPQGPPRRSCGRHPQGDHSHVSRGRSDRSLSGRRHGDLRSQRRALVQSPLGGGRSAELRAELVPHPAAVRFAGRTGKISLDAEAFLVSGLLGYISIAVTEDPMSIPSYGAGAKGTSNDEGAIVPRNGFEVVMQSTCQGYFPPRSPAYGCSMSFTIRWRLTRHRPIPGMRVDRGGQAQPLRARGVRRQGHRLCYAGVRPMAKPSAR